MKQMKQNFLEELKQAINSDEPLLIGEAGSLSYFRYTKQFRPQRGETFELVNGVLMRIGKFYVIREDDVQGNS